MSDRDIHAENQRRAELERQASSLAERARTRLGETLEPIKDKAMEVAEAQKQTGAEKMSGVAQAVRRAADDLGRDLPQAAGYVHQAADTIERASAALKERNLDDLTGAVGQFARSQPAAFFAAAVLAGFAFSRFVKSSAETPPAQR
jgi:F0F1-type ATP synthase membrane subunit b/b'